MTRQEHIDFHAIPIIDLAKAKTDPKQLPALARELFQACCESGFFYLVGHGISEDLQARLERVSHEFFAWDEHRKMQLKMELGGPAWRGYFPLGGELTSGKADAKEGLYLGTELDARDPRVQAGWPMHGPNLFPDIPDFRDTVLEYIHVVTALGHRVMELVSMSLALPPDYFYEHFTKDPLILFRIFHYPPDPDPEHSETWGVGEHTDYGLLTILKQDDCGGLEVKSKDRWIEAPPIPQAFVCNIGDMLERMTGGLYRSTPHRVRNRSGRERYSFPLFFDPGFSVPMRAIPQLEGLQTERYQRWDEADVHSFTGTYGDYLLTKVGRVFPDLKKTRAP